MQHDRGFGRSITGALILFILALSFPVATISAKKQPKTYPEDGRIIGTGTSQFLTRTYKVVTDTRTYELDCGKRRNMCSQTPGECGGDKKLQIGDVLHFRIEKGHAYIQVPKTVDGTGEQQLRVVREETKAPDAK